MAFAKEGGAIPFARVLPSPEGLKQALASNIPEDRISLFKPFTGDNVGEFEAALCRRWGIDVVLCRQSGGLTERLWSEICEAMKLELYLISRPIVKHRIDTFYELKTILNRVSKA